MGIRQENHGVISYQDEPQDQVEENGAPPEPPTDCGLLSRYPVGSVLGFAVVGICAGVGLSVWDGGEDTKAAVLQWVGLIGDLFLRALQAVVLPLVFVNVILAIVDMMSQGQAGVVGGKMVGFYILTTTLASVVAMLYIASFQGLFREGDIDEDNMNAPSTVQLGCGDSGSYLAHGSDGSVICSRNATDAASTFVVHDLDDRAIDSAASLSDTIYAGVFQRLVTRNILGSFIEANFAALVVFAVLFGVALAKAVILPHQRSNEESSVVKVLKELEKVFSLLIMWVISATPFAVLSLIAATVGGQDNLLEAFQNVGLLMVTVLLAMATHLVLVYGGLFALITRSNPKDFFYQLIPAQTTVFACASSVATIPVTLDCVKNTKRVPPPVSRLVCPIGASINMDGGAIYFPIACIWLAHLNGLEPSIGDYILLVIMSTVGSAGTASVPAASLVLIISAYNTVFGTTGAPYGFSFILAMDWFLDRCRATLNVTGDAVVSALVAKVTGLSVVPPEEANGKTSESCTDGMEGALTPPEIEEAVSSEIKDGDMQSPKASTSPSSIGAGQGVESALDTTGTQFFDVPINTL